MDKKIISAWPNVWYIVKRSDDLKVSAIASVTLAKKEFILFRCQTGKVCAIDSKCPHMGTHLRHGKVVGNSIQCPMHHWEIDSLGHCQSPDKSIQCTVPTWPIIERFGLIFLYPGKRSSPNIPSPVNSNEYFWSTSKPIQFKADWRALAVNGFDLTHLETVHHRKLVEPVKIEQNNMSVVLTYTTIVIGKGISDRIMKLISHNRINVKLINSGPIMIAQTNLGKIRTSAIFGYTQVGENVNAIGAFGVPKDSKFKLLTLLLTKWLFSSFLRKDFKIIQDMELNTNQVDDLGVKSISDYLSSLPEIETI